MGSLGHIEGEQKIIRQVGVNFGWRGNVHLRGTANFLVLNEQSFVLLPVGDNLHCCLGNIVLGIEGGPHFDIVDLEEHIAGVGTGIEGNPGHLDVVREHSVGGAHDADEVEGVF